MSQIDRIKNIWSAVYDPKRDVISAIEEYFHPDYTQCINGVSMSRPEYIDHVIAQRKSMVINRIEYIHHLESKDELFAIYYPKGKNLQGSDIEAEVISYFQFRHEQIIKIHGQVRLIQGNFADADMRES